MTDNRADSFLHLIRRSQRGRLKIYVGYCAGVGKTYQMLLEARQLKAEGIDIAVGLVETHGRKETEALLEGLEIISRKRVTHRGIDINEMDLDAILLRHPGVVLVDELAHTNVPGSRYAKRHQDVEEILAAGIHVISTLNIQHLESLYETIERATGVKVRERIPDRVVAEADHLVNVDITTEDLRKRLSEGKVYTKESIETALDYFFRPANLEQLRELTLRELAAQIDSRRRDLVLEETVSSPDQVMVCLSSRGPNSEALLRYASRLAGRLNRNWYAVYVQTTSEGPTAIDAETQRLLSNTLTLAQELGATVFTYRGDDIVKTILQFAKEYRVGHVVIGTPGKKLPFWRRLRGETDIVEKLISQSRDMTIVILDTKSIPQAPIIKPALPEAPQDDNRQMKKIQNTDSALSDNCVKIWDKSMDKEVAMRQLLKACYHDQPERIEKTWAELMHREQQGSTFVGENVLLPHTRVNDGIRPVLALGIGKSGIQDRKTGRMAKIMLLLLTPSSDPKQHIETLGMVSRIALSDQWQSDVLSAANPSKITQITNTRLDSSGK